MNQHFLELLYAMMQHDMTMISSSSCKNTYVPSILNKHALKCIRVNVFLLGFTTTNVSSNNMPTRLNNEA